MLRSGLFWKALLPSGALIVATALVMAANTLSLGSQITLFLLLVAAAVLHARWIARLVTDEADSLAASVNQLGSSDSDTHWRTVARPRSPH